jgi:hypothetical protein
MRIGTKSVLFGAHACWLHPWFVAWAWWRLYGRPRGWRLWLSFFVHDLGYWGKPNMDGDEGESHPEWAARFMTKFVDRPFRPGKMKVTERLDGSWSAEQVGNLEPWFIFGMGTGNHTLLVGRWGLFVLGHSRFYAKKYGVYMSQLCVADKYAIVLTPWWLYIPMAWASGELGEYLALLKDGKYTHMNLEAYTVRGWHKSMKDYLRGWVNENKNDPALYAAPKSYRVRNA